MCLFRNNNDIMNDVEDGSALQAPSALPPPAPLSQPLTTMTMAIPADTSSVDSTLKDPSDSPFLPPPASPTLSTVDISDVLIRPSDLHFDGQDQEREQPQQDRGYDDHERLYFSMDEGDSELIKLEFDALTGPQEEVGPEVDIVGDCNNQIVFDF